MYKLIGPKKNFEIWNLWNNYDADCGQLVGFINAGILDDAPDMFLTYWDRTLEDAQKFYDSLKEAVGAKTEIAWEIDYVNRVYQITNENDSTGFKPMMFVLNTLGLKDEYKEKVLKVLDERESES